MKNFMSKHKYKLLFALIVLMALGGGAALYLKKKKAKDLATTDKVGATKQPKEQPKEPLTIEEVATEDVPTKEVLKPAIIEPEDIPV